jgi:hypothetical protein
MKALTKITKAILILSLIPFFSCNPNPDPLPPSLEELQAETTARLTGTWSLASATRDNIDASGEFSGFTVTFSPAGFTTTNGQGVWPDTGSWRFMPGSSDTILRDFNVETLLVFTNNDTQLKMSFYAEATAGSGRTTGVAGNYVFVVNK